MTDNFGLGKCAKIEGNDGKELSIETISLIKTPESYRLILYLLLKLSGMTACPIVFPKRFNLLCLASKIKTKKDFQLVFEPVKLFETFLVRVLLFHGCPLAGNTRRLF